MDINYFPVDMNAFAAQLAIIEFSAPNIEIGTVGVDWHEQVCHPGGSVRYRLRAAGRKIVYATDIELDMMMAGEGEYQRNLLREYREFIQDADLLLADGQYTAQEYPSRVGWGHSSIPALLQVAREQKVRQVAVFHHDPQHSDAVLDTLWARYYAVYGSDMNVFWAREGMTVAV
jgi:phosphoribosyl 1,2-cyclic phosphodiesterase